MDIETCDVTPYGDDTPDELHNRAAVRLTVLTIAPLWGILPGIILATALGR